MPCDCYNGATCSVTLTSWAPTRAEGATRLISRAPPARLGLLAGAVAHLGVPLIGLAFIVALGGGW